MAVTSKESAAAGIPPRAASIAAPIVPEDNGAIRLIFAPILYPLNTTLGFSFKRLFRPIIIQSAGVPSITKD
jgi:hypothetical protein